MMLRRNSIWILVLGYIMFCFGVVSSISDMTEMAGDVTVAGLFYVKQTTDNDQCDGIITSSVQEIEAIKWIFKKLNKINFIDGVSLGLQAYATCGSPDRALKRAVDIVFMRSNSSDSCQGSPIVGVIGPEWSSEASVVSKMLGSLPPFSRLPQIGYSTTTTSLSNKDLFPNFFRVVPPDVIQIQVIVELMQKLDWTYVAIYYESNKYGKEGAIELEILAKKYGICVPVKVEVYRDQSEEELNYAFNNTLSDLRDKNGNRVGGVIFFGSSQVAKIMVKKANDLSDEIPFPVFVFSEAINTDETMFKYDNGSAIPAAKGVYHVNPLNLKIDDFATYWESIFIDSANLDTESDTNIWLLDVNNSISECQSSAEVCLSRVLAQGVYTQYAIRAALTMAWAIKMVHIKTCGRANSGLCPQFCAFSGSDYIAVLENAEINVRTDFLPAHFKEFDDINLSITFDGSHDIVLSAEIPAYEVHNFRTCSDAEGIQEQFCFTKVADFSTITNELAFDEALARDYTDDGSEVRWPYFRKAQCPDNAICVDCTRSSISEDILHIPGDLYIVGVAPVHEAGETLLSCGDIRQRDGFDIAEAIIYAVQKSQEQNMLIPTGTIGVILVDSCNDNILVQQKIISLHRFGLTLSNGTTVNINDKIIGYIGAFGSSVSLALVDISSRLEYAQISYGSASPLLSDRVLYPWFIRITSSVVKQVPVILQVIQNLGSNLVQLLHSEGAYGEGGADTLIRTVGEYGLCIAQSIVVNNGDQRYFQQILQSMRMYPDAKTIILFLRENALQKFLEVYNTEIELGEFILIGSESWGIGDFVNSATKLEGSITIAQVLPIQDGFREHITDLFPTRNDKNKWLQPYMESRLGCYYQWSFNKNIGQHCSDDARLDRRVNYRIDSWAPFAIYSVYALLQGAREALEELCPTNSYLCDAYRNRPDILVDKIKKVRLDLTNTQIKDAVFDTEGNGNVGYTIYNVQRVTGNADEMTYKEVGQWFTDGGFEFRRDKLVHPGGKVVSQCGSSPECQICFPLPEETELNPTGYIVGTVILALVLVIVIGFMVFLIRQKQVCSKQPLEDHYDSTRNVQDHYNYVDDQTMVSNQPLPSVQHRDSRSDMSTDPEFQQVMSLNSIQSGRSQFNAEESEDALDNSGENYLTLTSKDVCGRSYHGNIIHSSHLQKEDSGSSSYADVNEKLSNLKNRTDFEEPSRL